MRRRLRQSDARGNGSEVRSGQTVKELELENARLRRAVPELALDKLILTEAVNPSMASAGQMH